MYYVGVDLEGAEGTVLYVGYVWQLDYFYEFVFETVEVQSIELWTIKLTSDWVYLNKPDNPYKKDPLQPLKPLPIQKKSIMVLNLINLQQLHL